MEWMGSLGSRRSRTHCDPLYLDDDGAGASLVFVFSDVHRKWFD